MTLRYPYEVRDAGVYFDEIPDLKVPAEMLKLAEHILDTKAGEFDPSQFEDHYETALVEMLRKKQAGFVPEEAPAARQPAQVINLMDALKRSVAQERGGAPPTAAKTPAAKGKKAFAKKQEAQRNAPQFKLPIAGGKKREEAAKPAARPGARPAATRKRA
jgi:DNA end-binding protein Ku